MNLPAETLARLPSASPAGQARQRALASFNPHSALPEWVEYQSQGRLLLIGPADAAWTLARRLPQGLRAVVLATAPPAQPPEAPPPAPTVFGRVLELRGYLGAYTLELEDERGRRRDAAGAWGPDGAGIDLVVDLDPQPSLKPALPPPGYFHAPGAAAQEQALDAASGLVGSFQKPRYFRYEADICAHGARGLSGCRNCLDACATGAIRSLGERIEVDPYLCQGCGSCATGCPTGAIRYAWPAPPDLLDALRQALGRYRGAPGAAAPVLLFVGGEDAVERIDTQAATLPESVLPVAVEDIGALGPETWLSLLAYGATQILLQAPPAPVAPTEASTAAQIAVAGALLAGLGDPAAGDRIRWLASGAPLPPAPPPWPGSPAGFAALGNKREVLHLALSSLSARRGGSLPDTVALPAAAPFGEIRVDREACTLCMACVSVCPASAVTGGGSEPRLLFREDRCVQCGLCQTACPEQAISLVARFDFTAQLQPAERVLNEEPMLHCADCGKAFATQKLIERMSAKLKDHWMYQSAEARRRLSLCEDCRVKAIFSEAGGIETRR